MGSEEQRSIVITPFTATFLAAFVTLVVSGAGYIVSELRATHVQTRESRTATLQEVEKVRQEAKKERDRYREEILASIADIREAARALENRMFSRAEQQLYDQSIAKSRETLQARIDALESMLTRHLDNATLQGFAEK